MPEREGEWALQHAELPDPRPRRPQRHPRAQATCARGHFRRGRKTWWRPEDWVYVHCSMLWLQYWFHSPCAIDFSTAVVAGASLSKTTTISFQIRKPSLAFSAPARLGDIGCI